MMCTGKFPEYLKKTIIKPLYKKGDRLELVNYRPIALLSPFSKVFEKTLLLRITNFLEKEKVLVTNQFGYRVGRSTINAVTYITDKIAHCNSKKLKTLTIFLDLSKAFDCVDHGILLTILNKYGIRGNAFSLLNSYLNCRQQLVQIDCGPSYHEKGYIRSILKLIEYGVPQGSVLGPFLFIIYTNCIKAIFDKYGVDFVLYVDDSNIIITGKTVEQMKEIAELVLVEVNRFFSSLNLALNLNKTVCMLFNCGEEEINLKVNGTIIEQVTNTKILGIEISHTLSWANHIEQVTRNVSKGIFILKQTSQMMYQKHNLLVYHAFIHSFLSYGIVLWGNPALHKDLLETLFRKQKRAVRILKGIHDWRISCRTYFKELGILTLPSLYIYHSALYAKKFNSHLTNETLYPYNTRGKTLIHREVTGKRSISDAVNRIYNKLPSDLRQLNKIAFKKKLFKILVEHEFYSVNDFFTSVIS